MAYAAARHGPRGGSVGRSWLEGVSVSPLLTQSLSAAGLLAAAVMVRAARSR